MTTKKRWAPLGAEDVGREVAEVPGFVQVTRRLAVEIRARFPSAPLRCSVAAVEHRNGGYRWFARPKEAHAIRWPTVAEGLDSSLWRGWHKG